MVGRPKAEKPKDRRVNLRFSAEEYERLVAVADHLGVTLTSAIRFLIKREFDKLKK